MRGDLEHGHCSSSVLPLWPLLGTLQGSPSVSLCLSLCIPSSSRLHCDASVPPAWVLLPCGH